MNGHRIAGTRHRCWPAAGRLLVSVGSLVAIALSGAEPAFAEPPLPYLVDAADLLTASQEQELEQRLAELSDSRDADVVIVTVESLGGRHEQDFADDYFDYGPDPADPSLPGDDPTAGYGRGEERSGLLLLVSEGDRVYWLTTTGDAIDVFTDRRISEVNQEVETWLSSDNWYWAFKTFADEVDKVYRDEYGTDWLPVILVTLIGGPLLALIPLTIWRRQLKSVKPATEAKGYLDKSSVVLAEENDRLVHQSTHVINLATSSGPHGGSSTHFGSSGIRHGGGGGRF
jgi:uncharacterized protein